MLHSSKMFCFRINLKYYKRSTLHNKANLTLYSKRPFPILLQQPKEESVRILAAGYCCFSLWLPGQPLTSMVSQKAIFTDYTGPLMPTSNSAGFPKDTKIIRISTLHSHLQARSGKCISQLYALNIVQLKTETKLYPVIRLPHSTVPQSARVILIKQAKADGEYARYMDRKNKMLMIKHKFILLHAYFQQY